MNFIEGFITLLIGALIGGILGGKFGCWFTRHELGSESYKSLKRERDALTRLVETAIQSAEIQFVHHRCDPKPEQVEAKQEDSFDDWIPG